MSRQEHIDWCKKRALDYVDRGDLKNAVASMCSDITKHPETQTHMGATLGVMLLVNGHLSDARKVREWIDGFN